MPETPVTREQLLAAVHALQDGDLLVVRLPASMDRQQFDEVSRLLKERKPEEVRILVVSDEVAVEVVRPDDKASDLTEAVARATANPGQVVEVQP